MTKGRVVMAQKLTDQQRDYVLTLLKGGEHGRNEIARLAGVSTGYVTRLARQQGMASGRRNDQSQVKQLLEAAEAYTHERRLRFYDRAMARAEAMLEDPDLTPKELQAVMTTGAIANDKYRLETGEATSRNDHVAQVVIYVPASPRLSRAVDVAPAQLTSGQGTQG